MANAINSLSYNSNTYVFTTPYGSCSTAAGTAAKTVSVDNFSLETGARVTVKFTVTNTAASPTLNVNSTGAKAIYYNGAAITAGYLKANKVYEFVYNGTQWDFVGDIDTDTNTDTKVTAVGNHYAPSADSNAALSVDASSSTAATWNSTSLVTGVNLQRDAKGHVTGVTVDSIKMPANPNTDTHYTSKNIVGTSSTAYTNGAVTGTGGVYLNHIESNSNTPTSTHKIVGSGSVKVTSDSSGNITITGTDNNTDTKVTQTVTTTNATYPLLLAPNGQTATTTTTSYFDSGVTLNPSTNTIAANISGSSASCTGNAATATTATKATQDGSGNNIVNTYATKNTVSGKLDKLTYEWNKQYNAGGTAGYLLIGSFPMYDTNVTIDIDATTNITYHGTVVIATQNVSETSIGSAHTITVYGDPTGAISDAIRVVWTSGSRNYNVYFVPSTWSKNLIHIRAIGNYLENIDTSKICTQFTTGTAPTTTSGLTVVNALKSNFAASSHTHSAYLSTAGGSLNGNLDIGGNLLMNTNKVILGGAALQYSSNTLSVSKAYSDSPAASITCPTFIGALSGNATTATTATQLGSNAGSATQPVYFSGGKPVACTHTLGKSVPSDAKFTDTNTTYSAGTGISLSGTTFSNSGVRAIATGTANGTISVNTNGSRANVAVYGLGSAAYTASTAYIPASHAHRVANGSSNVTDYLLYTGTFFRCYSLNEKVTLGGSSYKWNTIYAKNGSIQTSDLNKKRDLDKLLDDERYLKLFDLIDPYKYRFKNGDRVHTGFISQYVEEALEEVGLTAEECGFFCKDIDVKPKHDENGNYIGDEEIYDDEGNPVYIYSLRYEEYIAIVAAKVKKLEEKYNKKLEEVDAKLAELEAKLG